SRIRSKRKLSHRALGSKSSLGPSTDLTVEYLLKCLGRETSGSGDKDSIFMMMSSFGSIVLRIGLPILEWRRLQCMKCSLIQALQIGCRIELKLFLILFAFSGKKMFYRHSRSGDIIVKEFPNVDRKMPNFGKWAERFDFMIFPDVSRLIVTVGKHFISKVPEAMSAKKVFSLDKVALPDITRSLQRDLQLHQFREKINVGVSASQQEENLKKKVSAHDEVGLLAAADNTALRQEIKDFP
ncbi:hypothetical protein HID58_043339, partial [Brassica napus]